MNPDAKRFGDESVYVTFANAIGADDAVRMRYQTFPTYAICDDHFRLAGFEFGRSMREWPEREIERGDTIAELAEKLGLDPVVFEETIIRFNRYCESGVDKEFHRGEVGSSGVDRNAVWGAPSFQTLAYGLTVPAPTSKF